MEKIKRRTEVKNINAIYISISYSNRDDATILANAVCQVVIKNNLLKKANMMFNSEYLDIQDKLYKISREQLVLSDELPIQKQNLAALKVLEKNSKSKTSETAYSTIQFNVNDNLQYLPIKNQISRLETVILSNKAKLSKLKLRKKWITEIAYELETLLVKSAEKKYTDLDGFIRMLRTSIKTANSEYVKSSINNFYKIFNIDILIYKNNSTTSLTIESRKILTKTAIAFIVFLFISVTYVLLSEAFKKYAEKN